MATLQSKIILCKGINVDKNYVNVLDYKENQMLSLCESQEHLVAVANDYSFIRNRGTISTNFKFDDVLKSNYIAFQNKDYSNKWFFAWIDEVNFIGEENTEIKYTIDAWSTWFSYWQKKKCFVVREHVNNDTIGLHTVPENLDVGEVIQESKDEFKGLNNCYFCILTTYDPVLKKDFEGVQEINGTLFGYEICLFDNDVASVETFLKATNKAGKIEGVLALFMCPKALFPAPDIYQITGNFDGATYRYYSVNVVTSDTADHVLELPMPINATRGFSDYTPKNNKLYCYPYNYLLVSNGVGNQNIYRYEDFYLENGQIATDISFAVQVAFSISISARIVPRGYQKIDYNIDESLPIAKFPNCSWSTDAFTNWLTDNAVNVGTQVVTTGAAAVSSIATGNVAGIVSTSSQIANLIGQFRQANLLPSITGGNNSGDVNFSANKNSVKFLHMRAKTEYLKMIDDYFTRFGYAIKSIEDPNITGRKYWNYVEIGASEEIGYGEVPSKYMDIINNACRCGVTIWHNHANVGNYNLDNVIV